MANRCDQDADRLAVLHTALEHWPLPLSLDVNPHLSEAMDLHRSWLDRYALADVGDPATPLVVLQAPRVAALAYPRADLPALSLAADWTGWFFHFDDYFDEGPLGAVEQRAHQTVVFMSEILGHRPGEGAPHPGPSLHRTRAAFADLVARTAGVMTDWQMRTFVFHLESYFGALVAEAMNREHGAIPDVKAYCALRRDTGPALPLLDLIEHAEGIRLPRLFHGSSLFCHLMDAAADVAGWINDVFSVTKEQEAGDFHNLVLVIQHCDGVRVDQAVRLTIGKIAERMRLLDGAAPAVDAWCRGAGVSQADRLGIHRWARGLRDFQHHADWYIRHGRYAALEPVKKDKTERLRTCDSTIRKTSTNTSAASSARRSRTTRSGRNCGPAVSSCTSVSRSLTPR
jgi:hypothetical protein